MPLEDILPVAGTIIGGVYGGPAGAAVGSATGKMFASGIKEGRAKKFLPPQEDPMQRGFLDEINQMRKSFEFGSAYASQVRQLKNIQAVTQAGIIKAAGGNLGAAVSGMARAGLNTQEAYGDVAAEGTKRQDALFGLAGEKIDAMAARKGDLALMQYGQNKGDAAELYKGGSSEFGKVVGSGKLNNIFNKKRLGGVGDVVESDEATS